MFFDIFKKSWAVFLSIAILMVGNGLQGTLISWRADYQGFPADVTGWIMTFFYVGFLAGSFFTSKLIVNVGHIRVFAAFASLASSAILLQAIYILPATWMVMRLITGFCYAGIYIIVESWLNEKSNNKTRGSTFALYMFITFGGMGLGQWVFKVGNPAGIELFVFASILLSVAMMPMLLNKISAPNPTENIRIKVIKLIKYSPAGCLSLFLSQLVFAAIFTMGAVYAINVGLNIGQIATFMSLLILGGAIGSWVLGWLSDYVDDRRKILALAAICAGFSYLALLFIDVGSLTFYIIVFVGGFFTLSFYGVTVSHINDRLHPKQMVSASGTIVLISGIGAVLGPLTSGYVINSFKTDGFLIFLASVNFVIFAFLLSSMLRRSAVPEEEQVSYQAIPNRATIVGVEAVAQEQKND